MQKMASNVLDEPRNVPGEPGEAGASLQSKIEAQRNKLKEIVESRFGLLPMLRSSRVLNRTEHEEIKAKTTMKTKNERLLEIICEKGKYQEFIDALWKSDQTHVVNWINGNGVYESEFGLDWPLSEKEAEILEYNYHQLSELLEVTGEFIGELFSVHVINKQQKDFFSSQKNSFKASQDFLDMMSQSSLKNYLLIAKCLRKLNADHIAAILEEVTVIVPVHANLEGDYVDELEKKLVDKVMKVLCLEDKESFEKATAASFLARLNLRIIAAKQGKSIVLYVSCCSLGEFRQLCSVVDSDDMKDVLEQLFNYLLQNLQTKVLLVAVTKSDRENAEKLFEREFLRDKKYDEHFERLRLELKYEEPMEVTTGESVEEKEEELSQKSKQYGTISSVGDRLSTAVIPDRVMSSTVDPTGIELLILEKDRWKIFEADDPDPALTATVAITDGDRHEIRIFSEQGLRRAIGIRSIKKCVIRRNSWIELTDQSDRKLAIRCREQDPNFMDFRERLITLIRLLKVKYEHTNSESRYPVVVVPEIDKSGDDVKVSDRESRFTIKTKTKVKARPPPLPPLSPEPETSGGDGASGCVYDYVVGGSGMDWKKVEEQGYLVPTQHRGEGNASTLPLSPSPTTTPVRHLDRTKSMPSGSWACYSCTLRNKLSDTHCDACGAQRPPTDSPGASGWPRAAQRPRKNADPPTDSPGAEGPIATPRPRKTVDQGCPNCQSPVVATCPECQVQKWRCDTCTIANPADAFECTGCMRIRDDAWQCHVCRDVIGLKVTWCRRCDVWRCQLCHVQNDARENDSRRCRTCEQISI